MSQPQDAQSYLTLVSQRVILARYRLDNRTETDTMIPAKNRDRKCSTCRHYQPSPLWRKGWCRNPLLYDRNTNHLVEADSLACNRTFIDYWEPITGPVPEVAPQARSTKPRIAPSIPMSTTDAQGNRGVVTGNTPAAGMAAFAQAQSPAPKPTPNREPPKLSLVTPDYAPQDPEQAEDGSKLTRLIEQIDKPDSKATAPKAATTAERIKQARKQRARFVNSTIGKIVLVLAVLVAVAAVAGGGYLLTRGKQTVKTPAVLPSPSVTRPAPTPTGFGDATVTPIPTTTPVPPPVGVIGINGWVQVKAGGGLSMRAKPGKSGAKVAVLPDGTTARVIEGPQAADGFTWWKLDAKGTNPAWSGWSAGQFLAPIPPPTK